MRRSGQGIRAQVGLSMIEVMAAMVIFSTGAVILFGWIAQMATRLSTLEVEQARLFAELSALEFTRSLNPMLQGRGEITLDQLTLRWTSQPVGEAASARALGGSPGLYVVQLYQVKLNMQDPKGGVSDQTVYQAGWRQVREASTNTPFAFDPK